MHGEITTQDSDEFTMLELRDDSVAQDQIALGPLNKAEIAQRMVTWVTSYQQHFLKFPLTLHEEDLPSNIDDARAKLRSFVEEVMANAPPLPSHIDHSQWGTSPCAVPSARWVSSRIQVWTRGKLVHAAMPFTRFAFHCRKTIAHHLRKAIVHPIVRSGIRANPKRKNQDRRLERYRLRDPSTGWRPWRHQAWP